MALFQALNPGTDTKNVRSFLNQLIDVVQQDISSSVSRRKYQVFVTGGVGPGVTSSLFQTVYDQDFTLQTANPVFDITFGIASPAISDAAGKTAASITTGPDDKGKYAYPSSSLMMREKTDIYGQFAQSLLGDRNTMFKLPLDASTINATVSSANYSTVDVAMFLAFKRLFARDQIKRETFAMRFYQSASFVDTSGGSAMPPAADSRGVTNLYNNSTTGSAIFTDVGSSGLSKLYAPGGQFGYLVNAASTSNAVGILYYDAGIAVLDVQKIASGTQFLSGAISAMSPTGQMILGTDKKAKLVPDLVCSGSIDNIIDHFCITRFGAGSLTAITFQNVTNINSSLIFCRLLPDSFNYSSNPTYVVSNTSDAQAGRLAIYDSRVEDDYQEPFAYVTTIGLYDASESLLAVAKLSRPVEKNPGRDLTFRVRLDF